MSHEAKLRENGSLWAVGAPNGTLHVKRHLANGEIAKPCGDDCKADHPDGARCVVPHVALIAKREQDRRAQDRRRLIADQFTLRQERAALIRAGAAPGDERLVSVDVEIAALERQIQAAL